MLFKKHPISPLAKASLRFIIVVSREYIGQDSLTLIFQTLPQLFTIRAHFSLMLYFLAELHVQLIEL